MNIKNRLKFLIDTLKISYKDFSKKTGIPYTSLQNYIYGSRQPTIENLQKICTQLNVNLNWLLTGEGEMFINKPVAQPVTEDIYKYIGKDFVLIPMVSRKISAGKGLAPVEDAEVEMKLAFRLDWIRRKGDYTKMSLIRVEGDSMEPTLYSGDIVLIDGNRNFVDLHGGIYAIYIKDSIMIKRIQYLFAEEKLKIISDNPKYESIIVSPDDLHVIGKVIWIGREIERA
ncbi:XRE family transcriptional regulator [Thermodesulfovibrio yellowstonii]|uniref:XRE family transcriptional regulator n=1 Tax=Thermodesulfovibrio yellowstonii TaxID=28262 RepID=UPI0024B39E6D|nr:XRE family transcriptional regulator [Thermodesulfovibrio yellowstonii]